MSRSKHSTSPSARHRKVEAQRAAQSLEQLSLVPEPTPEAAAALVGRAEPGLRIRKPLAPPTEVELILERHRMASSISETKAQVEAALLVDCHEHDAPAGTYCFAAGHAVCAARLEAGWAVRAPAPVQVVAINTGELEKLADATRRAQRDARIRSKAAADDYQRKVGRAMFRV